MYTQQAINNDKLLSLAPSIFAPTPWANMSSHYKQVKTIDVVESLRSAGWQVMQASQTRVRLQDKQGFQKHMLRFRHPDMVARNVNDLVPELVMLNSHDGTAAYQLLAGIFRMVCSNGLIVADSVFERLAIRHNNRAADAVVDASFKVVSSIPKVMDGVKQLQSVQLSDDERTAFALSAMPIKWEEGKQPVSAAQLLQPRRYGDNAKDLWTTFNVVQENMIKGGIRGRSTTNRRMTTKSVKSVNEDTRINRALWTLAEKMKEIKNGTI